MKLPRIPSRIPGQRRMRIGEVRRLVASAGETQIAMSLGLFAGTTVAAAGILIALWVLIFGVPASVGRTPARADIVLATCAWLVICGSVVARYSLKIRRFLRRVAPFS